jgi:hypothetical protein
MSADERGLEGVGAAREKKLLRNLVPVGNWSTFKRRTPPQTERVVWRTGHSRSSISQRRKNAQPCEIGLHPARSPSPMGSDGSSEIWIVCPTAQHICMYREPSPFVFSRKGSGEIQHPDVRLLGRARRFRYESLVDGGWEAAGPHPSDDGKTSEVSIFGSTM